MQSCMTLDDFLPGFAPLVVRFSNNPRWREATRSVLPPAPDDYSILLVDPPEHRRLRRCAARAFTRERLLALNETIARTAAEIVERAARRRTIDWIAEVAEPLAMRVMLAMMGLPENEHRRWEVWSRRRARLLEMIATRHERKAAHIAGSEIRRYFTALLRQRTQSREDDAVSTLARLAAAGEGISTAEASDMLSVLMIAGNETTTHLIGNGMLALVRHPEQMQCLREEPERVRDAINEMLRFDSPVQTDFRIAKEDVVVRGQTIGTGDGVILLTGSANRDGAAFENPDTFDITRTGPRHASFGHGVHQCIGAELARMEARGPPAAPATESQIPPYPRGGRGPKEPALLRSASGEAEARDLTQLHCTGKSATLNRPPKRGNLKQFMETAGAAEVVACLDSGADLEARDLLGWTPLHMASRARNPEAAEALLVAGADVMARGELGGTPLHHAASTGSSAVAETLLRAGADVMARDTDGQTPLHVAATWGIPFWAEDEDELAQLREGKRAVAEALLRAGAPTDVWNRWGTTPLHLAAETGALDVVTALAGAGADLLIRDADL